MGFEFPQLRVNEANTAIEDAYAFHYNALCDQDAEIASYTDSLTTHYRWKGVQQTALQIPRSIVNVVGATVIVVFKLVESTLATLQSITHCARRTLGQRVEMTFQRELIEIIDDWRSTAISIAHFAKTVFILPVGILSGPIQVIDPLSGLKLRRELRAVDLVFFKTDLDLSPFSICVISDVFQKQVRVRIVSDAFSSKDLSESVLKLHSDLKSPQFLTNSSGSLKASTIIKKIVSEMRKPKRD
jgi:hypothetical protein